MLDDWAARDLDHRLGAIVGEWPKALGFAPGQDHGPSYQLIAISVHDFEP